MAADIEETPGHAVNYPMIDDPELKTAKLYGIPPSRPGEDIIIPPAVPDEEAKAEFPGGWKTQKPYLRIAKQPK